MQIPDALRGIELFECDIYEEDMKCDDTCWNCNGVCITRWVESYHGWRGYCPDCGSDFPCS